MKFKSILFALLSVLMLTGCYKEELYQLHKEIDTLKNDEIFQLQEQYEKISTSIGVLEGLSSTLNTCLEEMRAENAKDIEALENAQEALDERIDALKDYVGAYPDDFSSVTAWARGTFSTLEQQKETERQISEIRTLLEGLGINVLDLIDQIYRDIAASAESVKSWMIVELRAYYTAGEVEGKISALKQIMGEVPDSTNIQKEIESLCQALADAETKIENDYTAAITAAITGLEGKLTDDIKEKIKAANERIDGLESRVLALETKLDLLTGRVTDAEAYIELLQDQIDSIKNKDINGTLANLTDNLQKALDALKDGSDKTIKDLADGLAALGNVLTDLTGLQNQINDMKDKENVGSLANLIDALEKKVSVDIANLIGDASNDGDTLEKLEGRLIQAETTLRSMTSVLTDISELQTELSSLKAKVGNAANLENEATGIYKVIENTVNALDTRLTETISEAVKTMLGDVTTDGNSLGKLEDRIELLESAVSEAGDIYQRIFLLESKVGSSEEGTGLYKVISDAIKALIGDATTDGDTLGELEARLKIAEQKLASLDNVLTDIETVNGRIDSLVLVVGYAAKDEHSPATGLFLVIDQLKEELMGVIVDLSNTLKGDATPDGNTLGKLEDRIENLEDIVITTGNVIARIESLEGKVGQAAGEGKEATGLYKQIADAVSAAVTQILGGAKEDYNTLGKLEAKLIALDTKLTKLDGVLGSIEDIQGAITGINEKIGAAKKDESNPATGLYKVIDDAVAALDTELREVITTLENSLKSDATDDGNTLGKLEDRIETLESAVNSTTGILARLDELEDKVGNAAGEGKEASGLYKEIADAVAKAVSDLIGGATSSGNTLKKLEDRLAAAETTLSGMTNVLTDISLIFTSIDSLKTAVGYASSEGVAASGLHMLIEALETAVGTPAGEGKEASGLYKEISDAIKALIGDASTSGNTLKKLEDRIAALYDDIHTTGGIIERLVALENKLDKTIDGNIYAEIEATIATEIAKVVGTGADDEGVTLTTLNKRLADLETMLDGLDNISDVLSDITTLEGRIDSLQTAVGYEKGDGKDATGLHALIQALEDALGVPATTGVAATGIYALIDGKISEIIGGATDAGNTLKKLEDRIAALEDAVVTTGKLNERITALETALGSKGDDKKASTGIYLEIENAIAAAVAKVVGTGADDEGVTLTTLNKRLADLETMLDGLDNISDVLSHITTLEGRIDSLQTAVGYEKGDGKDATGLHALIQALEDALGAPATTGVAATGIYALIDGKISDIIGGATDAGNTLKKLEDRIAALEDAVVTTGKLNERITALETALGSKGDDKKASTGIYLEIENAIAAAVAKIVGNDAEGVTLTTLNKRLADLETALNGVDLSKIADLASAIESLETAVGTEGSADTDPTGLYAKIAELSAEIGKQAAGTSEATGLYALIAAINSKIGEPASSGDATGLYKAISDAISNILGGASTSGNTLKKLEDSIASVKSDIDKTGGILERLAALETALGEAGTEENPATGIYAQLEELNELLTKLNPEALEEMIGKLESGLAKLEAINNLIQTITYIPEYSDGKADLHLDGSTVSASFNFLIKPEWCAGLVNKTNASMKIIKVKTRAGATTMKDFPIEEIEVIKENDKPTGEIAVSAKSSDAATVQFLTDQSDGKEASVALFVETKDEKGNITNSVSSSFISTNLDGGSYVKPDVEVTIPEGKGGSETWPAYYGQTSKVSVTFNKESTFKTCTFECLDNNIKLTPAEDGKSAAISILNNPSGAKTATITVKPAGGDPTDVTFYYSEFVLGFKKDNADLTKPVAYGTKGITVATPFTDEKMTFYSSNEAMEVGDGVGLEFKEAKAKYFENDGSGTVTVYAKLEDTVLDSAKLTYKLVKAGYDLSLDKGSAENDPAFYGQTSQLTVGVTPENATFKTYSYSTEDSNLSISDDGKITVNTNPAAKTNAVIKVSPKESIGGTEKTIDFWYAPFTISLKKDGADLTESVDFGTSGITVETSFTEGLTFVATRGEFDVPVEISAAGAVSFKQYDSKYFDSGEPKVSITVSGGSATVYPAVSLQYKNVPILTVTKDEKLFDGCDFEWDKIGEENGVTFTVSPSDSNVEWSYSGDDNFSSIFTAKGESPAKGAKNITVFAKEKNLVAEDGPDCVLTFSVNGGADVPVTFKQKSRNMKPKIAIDPSTLQSHIFSSKFNAEPCQFRVFAEEASDEWTVTPQGNFNTYFKYEEEDAENGGKKYTVSVNGSNEDGTVYSGSLLIKPKYDDSQLSAEDNIVVQFKQISAQKDFKFDSATATAYIMKGADKTYSKAATGAKSGSTVTYSIGGTNTAEASVNPSTGEVAYTKQGAVEIVATASATEQCEQATASYTLTVKNKYKKADGFEMGHQYIIVSNDMAMENSQSETIGSRKTNNFTIDDTGLVLADGVSDAYLVWTALKNNSGYILNNQGWIVHSVSYQKPATAYKGTEAREVMVMSNTLYTNVAHNYSNNQLKIDNKFSLHYSNESSSWYCGNSGQNTSAQLYESPVDAETVPVRDFNLSDIELDKGENTTLTISIEPYYATDQVAEWKSNDKSVATVTADGKVTAIEKGVAIISCELSDITKECTVTVSDDSGGGCLAIGTRITMADGTFKKVEDLVVGDRVRTIDHITGKISSSEICLPWKSSKKSIPLILSFASGKELSIIKSHDLLSEKTLKYLRINKKNVDTYIGKRFYNAELGRWDELVGYKIGEKPVAYYCPYVREHLNCIAEGMLTVPDNNDFFLNIYELDKNLKADSKQLASDVEKYGLMDVARDFPDYVQFKKMADALMCKYIFISLGKGYITEDELVHYLGTSVQTWGNY